MDLLVTVRKEGSRGGRGDFKWSDVQNSSHREHYLGHSLMAPVGRWQQGRDLNWYAKGEGDNDGQENPAERAARERKEEIRRIKEAEEDALARALGLPVAPRNNANLEPLANQRDVNRVIKETAGQNENQIGRGIGFGSHPGDASKGQVLGERLEGNAEDQDKQLQHALKEYERRHGDSDRRRRRSRSRDRNRERKHRRNEKQDDDKRRRHRSRSADRYRRKTSKSRSRSPDRSRREQKRDRSRSPYRRREDRDDHSRSSHRDYKRR